MDSKTLALVAAAVLILGGGWYLMSAKPSTETATSDIHVPTPTTENTAETAPPTSPATAPTPKPKPKPTPTPEPVKPSPTAAKLAGIGPMSNIIAFKESLSCAVESTGSTDKRTGLLYVANGKVRGDFSSSAVDTKSTVSLINDGTFLYVWEAGDKTGLKLIAASSVSGTAVAARGAIDPSAQISYACNPWTVDANVFKIPEEVTFTDSWGNPL